MSTLNLCLQNVALCRKAMPEEFEKMLHNKLTLGDIRKVTAINPALVPELVDSMAQPIKDLSRRFMSMKIKEDRVKMSEPAQDHDISAVFENIHGIDPTITAEKLRKEDLKDKTPLLKSMNKIASEVHTHFKLKSAQMTLARTTRLILFMSHQSNSHHCYLFWIPPRRTINRLRSCMEQSHWLIKDQPSSKPSSNEEAVEAYRSHKPILKNTKVRKVITCGDYLW